VPLPIKAVEDSSNAQDLQAKYYPIPMHLGSEGYVFFPDKTPPSHAKVASTFTSVPFKFVVGDETFHLHKLLVCSISEPLERLVNGSMHEALDGQATIHDIEPHTFSRFCQWVYTGTYATAREEDISCHDLDKDTSGKSVNYASLNTLYSTINRNTKLGCVRGLETL